jgi:prephenate dehydratase
MKATSSCLFLLVLHAGVEAFAWVAPRAVAHMKRPRGGENLNLALVPEPSSPAQLVTRVAFQGEPGAYSEKATRELLGKGVMAEGKPTFEDVFRAVSSREADYAVVPIENTLGGSIHANYDLMLRYDLYVIGEHEFRVEHSLMALPGTKIEDLKTVMSHAQALAQCDNYLRGLGVERKPVYDTAGSAKLIAEGKMQGVGAIASELAASTYGLEVLASNCEDDHVNFTRFLLLARAPVGVYMPSRMPAKTSIVFTLPNAAGALYKALACFSLRDIDFSKIESRPTSAQLLQHLRMRMDMTRKSDERKVPRGGGSSYMPEEDAPRFQYCFYLDFLASELKTEAQAALSHLKELSPYVRVLGSYPSGGTLVGPVSEAIKVVSEETSPREDYSSKLVADDGRLRVGIVGFGKFGQFLSKSLSRHHTVSAMGRDDTSSAARTLKIPYFPVYDQESFFRDLDVIIFSVSIVSFEEVLRSVPTACLRGKLIVDVLSVKMHAKHVMLDTLPPDADILCTHPMFGPESGKVSWQSLPFLYDKVRVSPEGASRCDDFLASIAAERYAPPIMKRALASL